MRLLLAGLTQGSHSLRELRPGSDLLRMKCNTVRIRKVQKCPFPFQGGTVPSPTDRTTALLWYPRGLMCLEAHGGHRQAVCFVRPHQVGDGGLRPVRSQRRAHKGLWAKLSVRKCLGPVPRGSREEAATVERDTPQGECLAPGSWSCDPGQRTEFAEFS